MPVITITDASVFHEQSTLPLGLARNGCIKPLMFLRNILRQGLSTSGFAQLVHVSTFGIAKYKKKLPFLLFRDTNTGGAEVPCHGIILDGTPEPAVHQQTTKV